MNKFIRLIACTVLVSAPLAGFAQGNSGQMHRGGVMGQEQMQQMNENMSRMQEMMQEMHNTNSSAERDQLREQHMSSMREHMGMMRGGTMQPGHGMRGDGSGMMNNQGQRQSGDRRETRAAGEGMDNEQRMEMMENRMNQMQLMMEQMLEHMDPGQRSR